LAKIRKEYAMKIILMNYSKQERKQNGRVPIVCMFNEIAERMPYPNYINYLSQTLINIDVTYDFTYGRGMVDAAALKVPTIGSKTIEAQHKLWPELAITPGKDWEMEAVTARLLGDDDWREEMAQQGYERCDIYSLENSYMKMVKILEEA
jgi:hypothetical protein